MKIFSNLSVRSNGRGGLLLKASGLGLALLAAFSILASGAAAQSGSPASSSKKIQETDDPIEGIDIGNYHYQGSVELGYRTVNILGSGEVYDTFVDEKQGPRLLDQTLSMRSLDHQGVLFDTLFLSSFGWGGDAENAGRLRMSKDKWYDFNMTFRRDHNFFNYNDLANPLNPPNPYVPVEGSPHAFDNVRRMYDYNLTLRPQSAVRVRLGYTRNNTEGPAFSSVHQGTDTMLFQNTRNLLDAYQFGVDVKLLPRTNISYDQFLQYYKGDSSWQDQSLIFQLSNGTPVDPGISYNPGANQPCATPVTDPTTTPPTFSATCSGYLSYNRWAPVRTSYPTEQITMQSRYFRNVDLSARVSYSSSQTQIPNWFENFNGLGRNRLRGGLVNGPASSQRIVGSADFGATVSLTSRLRVIDNFRFSNFRIPGGWNLNTSDVFAPDMLTAPNVFDTTTCPAPYTAATCPQHTANSVADVIQDQRLSFLRQDSSTNTFELEYDFTRRVTGHMGYRYETREINNNFFDLQNQTFFPTFANRGACATVTLVNGVCNTDVTGSSNETTDVHAHSLLAGASARPTDQIRATFDFEWLSADNAPTRISPRNLQHFKVNFGYSNFTFKPQPRITVRAGYNLTSTSGTTPLLANPTTLTPIGFNYHKPTASIDANLAKGVSLISAWGYNDYNEKYLAEPLSARDFQSNQVTVSMRYEF